MSKEKYDTNKQNLSKISTYGPRKFLGRKNKAILEQKRSKYEKKIAELQQLLYAEKKQALLIILQGMDASGKDSTADHVFSACSQVGVQVHSFKTPTKEENDHDFLWRAHQLTPAKGMIHLFVRSYYEYIVTQRVHEMIKRRKVRERMRTINAFEQLLQSDNNTRVIKFFLHISIKEQKQRFLERLKENEKQWKFDPKDIRESRLWPKYMKAYNYAIANSTIPWHIIPADDKLYRDFLVSKIVYHTLKKMNPSVPRLRNAEKDQKRIVQQIASL